MAAESSNFVQPAIPKFDGHYDHWSMLIENFLRSKEYWSLVENGIPVAVEGIEPTKVQQKAIADHKLKDLKDFMKQKYQGSTRVKRAQLQALRREFEVLQMKEDPEINDFKRMNGHGRDEQALKVTYNDKFAGRGGRGRGAFRGRGRGRGRQAFNKAIVECYKCHQLGHFQYECPKYEKRAHYAELDEKEEMLLMSYVELNQSRKEDVWFLDSGCSNHMCGNKLWFSDLDEEFRQSIKLGNNSKMTLRNNLLSVGQLQEKRVAILIQHGECRVYHPKKGLIMQTSMQFQRGACGEHHRGYSWYMLTFVDPSNLSPIVKRDRGGEFTYLEFNAFCKTNGVSRQLTAAYTPQQNGVVERKNRTIMNMVRSMLSEKQVPKNFWPEAVNWTAHVLNRSPTLAVKDNKRKKLDDKSFQCVLLGVSEESKAYRLYDPVSKKIVVSRDVVFEEDKCWNWRGREEKEMTTCLRVSHLVKIQEYLEKAHQAHNKGGTEEYHSGWKIISCSKFQVESCNGLGNRSNRKEWDLELMDLPEGVKKIGVKWVFKTKLNENGKVDKCKARLVAKGYAQQHGIDYTELDVKSAFLHGELNEAVFIEQPQGYEKKGEEHKVYKLKKALYGLKQAPRAWYSRIEAYFIKEGLRDAVVITHCSSKQEMENSMKLEFDMTNLGKMKYFLGVEVLQNSEGIYISQRKYAKEVLKRFGMEESNSVKNPIVPGDRLTKNEGGVKVDATKFMASPTEMHLQAAKRVLRDVDDRKSTSGYVFLLSEGAVAWYSKKQPVVTLSTTEAKFVAAASCACQGVWMRRVLEKLGHSQGKCTIVLCDNSSTIKLSKNPVMHGRNKHIDVRFHFLRDLTRKGVVELKHCGTQEQVADIMTKPLKLDVFLKLRELLGVSVVPRVN
ncbi:Retrovirus-related Pol polyprotein from transposon RE1 [Vitis vinifera]|uniref:Retrovirus-related Pol polyprotein from transposon RE1 n=1 Tax=Vitis vinifera TaxID=29760 RepID=A0A438E4N6_VITVI|nr:Retrovirus-related Pol polyprotein from transposon RE1 [Vitis vinifera]